jgi:hypothetical protein
MIPDDTRLEKPTFCVILRGRLPLIGVQTPGVTPATEMAPHQLPGSMTVSPSDSNIHHYAESIVLRQA